MPYKLILDDGELIGKYCEKKTPGEVAKCAMKVIFRETGRNDADINFVNTKTQREYTYRTELEELDEPIEIQVGGKIIFKKYIIKTKRI